MKIRPAGFIAALVLVLSTSAVISAPTASAVVDNENPRSSNASVAHRPVCGTPQPGTATCFSQVVTNGRGTPQTTNTTPVGFGPAQFHGAYNVPATATVPITLGIVDAYDHPNIKSDLDIYNSNYGLPYFPSCSSTVTTACFKKVNQKGATKPAPAVNSDWALEISLDVETAHQMCQNCTILLVEATTNAWSDLLTAEDKAVELGAKAISNSYGGSEFASEVTFDSHFNHPGIAITASSGDHGYGTSYPASSPFVTAVGGTTLTLDSANNWVSETAWANGGSGCSVYEPKPSFQLDSGCLNRTVADVAADADPASGAAVYDSVTFRNQTGWFQIGGTSLAAPLVSALYAFGGVPAGVQENTLPYASSAGSSLHDVVTGSNGTCGTYLCNADVGYDGPTGFGSPFGAGAF
jgi:subtilase family serine protease